MRMRGRHRPSCEAIAPSADALIAFRVVQALGAACLVPSALALVLHAFAPAHRRHGVALLSAVGAAAAGFGPSLGGLLVTAAGLAGGIAYFRRAEHTFADLI